MYFPYLRGRQNEIIALRELLERGLISPRLVPILEPVKLSSTLIKTMQKYVESDRELVVIHNPKVGGFEDDLKEAEKVDLADGYREILLKDGITKGHILNVDSDVEIPNLAAAGVVMSDVVSLSYTRDSLSEHIKHFSESPCKYSLIPNDRKFKRVVNGNRVLLADRYNRRERNVDYIDVDEFYSDDHLYCYSEGFVGFSDYSIVGKEYSENGFAPRAVAIHLLYFNDENELNLIHFVSDSNDDIRDPAGKFYEAVTKLYKWGKDKDINTFGYKEFIRHYENQTYPGLGVVKRLSIMHHLELMSQFLEGERA